MDALGFAPTFQRYFQSLQADLRVKAVRGLPAEHVPGVEIHGCHPIEEAFLNRDVGDVSGMRSTESLT